MKTPEEFTSMPGVSEVPASTVAALVRAGVHVWSYGYGEDEGDDLFDCIEESDLWAFPGEEDPDEGVVADWAPFVIDIAEATHVNAEHAAKGKVEGCDWC